MTDFDTTLRTQVYDATIRHGAPPPIAAMAESLSVPRDEVRESLRRLAAGRVLVLQPDDEILMAPPFSAVPTPFRVTSGAHVYYANCIWDALGVPAMLHGEATIDTSCGDCGTAARVEVSGGAVRGDGLMHFAVPARAWWNDIVFT